ncbi:IS30 family transposase [uncultured Nitrospira sp.]|uniref:IS30 family transposase n=1 Tax=uncultured Nitrospira sp. TaxID=157176 RepID=UPI0031408451
MSREVQRNQGRRGYRPQQAHRFPLLRLASKTRRRIAAKIWHRVNRLLKKEWSPEQISGWLRMHQGTFVSLEWIYQHVYRDKQAQGTLYRHLRCQRHRRKRYGTYSCRGHIPNRISIEHRPAVVERRSRLGAWEADNVISKGHQPALIS